MSYKCIDDNTDLKLTGEEGPNAWFVCNTCNKRYEVDVRDDSIKEYKGEAV
jgi:DNA-directed RNA polymerase subunit RPC12/RpoP